jgi:hypothetical protein
VTEIWLVGILIKILSNGIFLFFRDWFFDRTIKVNGFRQKLFDVLVGILIFLLVEHAVKGHRVFVELLFGFFQGTLLFRVKGLLLDRVALIRKFFGQV